MTNLVKSLRKRVRRWADVDAGKLTVLRNEQYDNLVAAYEHALAQMGALPLETQNEMRRKLLPRLLGTQIAEAYAIISGVHATAHLSGVVCEFGVAQGETSAVIANEIRGGDRAFHLFDSFEGLPEPTDEDRLKDDIFNLGSMDAYTGTMSFAEDLVLARLAAVDFPKDRYVIHKGFFGDVVARNEGLPEQVSFGYVDFDFYEPIVQALEFLDARMPAGGVTVVDDYDWFSTGAKTAVDEFVERSNAGGERYTVEVADKALGHFAVLRKVADQ